MTPSDQSDKDALLDRAHEVASLVGVSNSEARRRISLASDQQASDLLGALQEFDAARDFFAEAAARFKR